ncbi:MAG: GspH/FimT family pseudopilin [Gemmatimonadota bacterium]|nr:MAG: GspH/FimT family pseudopilin [Gemmatimonadota bacterium]
MRNKGFTLTELIVVLILAGVAMAIVSPSLGRAFRRTGVRAAVDEFASTHSLARAAAVRYGRLAELHIDAGNRRFWVEVDTSTTGGVKDTVGVVKYVGSHGVSVTSTRAILCFDGRGLPTTRGSCQAADATLVFSSGGRTDTVTVSALGRVFR